MQKNKKLMWLGQSKGYFHTLVDDLACPSVIKVARALDKELENFNYHDVEEFKELLILSLNKDYKKEIERLQQRNSFLEGMNEL